FFLPVGTFSVAVLAALGDGMREPLAQPRIFNTGRRRHEGPFGRLAARCRLVVARRVRDPRVFGARTLADDRTQLGLRMAPGPGRHRPHPAPAPGEQPDAVAREVVGWSKRTRLQT